MDKWQVAKTIEVDYGHTLPKHLGFCNQIHGHRAIVEAVVSGVIDLTEGAPTHGMVIDFGELKRIMVEKIHTVLDHGFAVWEKDIGAVYQFPVMGGQVVEISTLDFIKTRNKKILITKEPPTAEYLAQWAYDEICQGINELKIKGVVLLVNLDYVIWNETSTSYAKYPV